MDLKRAKKLAVILRNSKYEPSEPQNQVSGLVSEKTLETILQSAQLSREELVKKNQSHCYPFIRGDFRIWCFRGRRRILAALIAFGSHSEITVKLYCKTEGKTLSIPVFPVLTRKQSRGSAGSSETRVRAFFTKLVIMTVKYIGTSENTRMTQFKLASGESD